MTDENIVQPGTPQPSGDATTGTKMGLMVVRNNDQIEAKHRMDMAQLEEQVTEEPIIDAISQYILHCWREAKDNKEQGVEHELMDSWRRRKGEYDPGKLSQILSSGQTPIFMRLTEIKCNAFEAWFNEVVMTNREKLWSLKPTPAPSLPAHVQNMVVGDVMKLVAQRVAQGEQIPVEMVYQMAQDARDSVVKILNDEAKARCEKMSNEMHDILQEGNWQAAQDEALEHLATFGTCIIKGPIVRRKNRLQWLGSQAAVMPEFIIEYEAVHPLNLYPSPGSVGCNDGYLIELVEMRRKDIEALKGHPGYNSDKIELLLDDHYKTGVRRFRDLDLSRLRLADSPEGYHQQYTDIFQGIEYHGPINGKLLAEWGMEVADEQSDYEIECLMFGNYVIRCVLNDNPLNMRKYSKSAYKPRSGSFWGQSIAMLMKDVQDICNGAARAMINNMSIASGPMVVIEDIARIPEGTDLTSLHPWMVMQFTGDRTSSRPPVQFFSPDSHANELMAIYEKFMREADDRTGIPAYSYGNDQVAGAGRTASGLSMLMNSAARGIKKAITDWDRGIIQECLERLYIHLMLYHPDEGLKGDAQVVASGALGIFAREQEESALRDLLGETGNPIDLQLTGEIFRAKLLRRRVQLVSEELADAFPTDEELLQRMEMQHQAAAEEQQMAAQQQPEMPM